jgi:transposase
LQDLGSARPNAVALSLLQLAQAIRHLGRHASPQRVRHLLHCIPGTIFLFWDGLNTHRSKKTQAALAPHRSRLHVYRLPAYAPELNPDEGLWAWMKQHALAGQCPPNLEVLEQSIRLALRRLRRRPHVIRSFFRRSPLSF